MSQTPADTIEQDQRASLAVPSWQSRLLIRLLPLLGRKKLYASAASIHAHLRRQAQRPAPHRPIGLGRGVTVVSRVAAGWPVYETAPAGASDVVQRVVYLHGGGYVSEIGRAHWSLVRQLTLEAPARCTVPIYPLAPRGTARATVSTVVSLLRDLLATAGAEHVTVVGDSAGAGLALAAAQELRTTGAPQPRALVLISPWLDASVRGEDHAAIAARDPLLDIPGLAEAGRLYAGDLDVSHPFVSPLHGDLRGLAPLTVFTGTRDLLHPDSLALARSAEQARVPITVHARAGLPHSFALMPTPEGREARARIVRVVAG